MQRGLDSREAAARLERDGPNELPTDARRSWLGTLIDIVREPMIALLVGAGVLYVILGDLAEALALMCATVGMIGLSLWQARRTQNAVDRLRDMTAPTARVVRGGETRTLPTRELVAGDVVFVEEGDRVPADGWLVAGTNVSADESLLTGESVPVTKLARDDAADGVAGALPPPGGDGQSAVFAGTLVTQGRGEAVVAATGPRSAMGRIGRALAETKTPPSGIEVEIGRLVKVIALVGAGLCVVLLLARGLGTGDWIGGLLGGLTLAMAILPEEMPVVLMVFTTLGAFRIARLNVLARRPAGIQKLGMATVVCVDKTGTITENAMRVARLEDASGQAVDIPKGAPAAGAADRPDAAGAEPAFELAETFHEVLELAILGSAKDPTDPMERALHALGARSLRGTEHLHPDWSEERDYPLTRELLAVSHVWRSRPPRRIVAAKGSPETIADLCHLAPGPAAALAARAEALAVAGLRVLAVARAAVPEGVELPAGQHDFDFELVGLVAFEDPVRASVPAAVQAFADAGVRVVMITGDHVATARAIAGAAGIRVRRVVSGPELEAMDDATLSAAVGEVDVFARAVPDHKLRIVRALAARGEQVAMIGDGVNDAPALQAAHVGVALGHRGTDVAREAAALVMTTDDFGAVAHAIALGRRIDANLRRALGYLVAVHLPIAAMSLLPVLFGLSPMLLPVHVLFIELIIDPACSVALEAEAADPRAVRAPPRRPEDGLFPRSALLWSVVQGLVMLAVAAAAYFGALASGLGQDEARTLGFIVIVTGNAWLIQVSRSNERSALTMILTSRNRAALGILVAAFAVLALTLVVPPLAAIFHFGHLGGGPILLAFAAGSASALWFDAVKAVRARRVASTGAWSPT